MHEYDFNTYSVRKKSSNRKFIFLGLFVVCAFSLFWLFSNKSEKKQTLGKSTVSEITYLAGKVVGPHNPLEDVVTKSLTDTQGQYAVVIVNKKKNQSYLLNEHVVYDSASLYKLWIMAVAFEQIQAGQLQEDTVLEGDVAALNKKFRIATDSAELTTGEVSFTVGSALRQMITISHNYAALLLTEKVRLSTVKKFLADNGFHESTVGVDGSPPTTTASDIALFFEKLSQGELANEQYTQQMLDLLKDQRLNNKLTLYLPENSIVGHKTGELGQYSHDAGIVYLPESEYIIVLMSKSKYPPQAEDQMARVSQAVYDYYVQH